MVRYRLNPIILLINNGGYTIEVGICVKHLKAAKLPIKSLYGHDQHKICLLASISYAIVA